MDAGAATAELDAALANAWAVLDLPIPETTGVCRGCCMDPAIEADFLNHAARDLPDAYIRDWYFAAYADDLGYAQMGWLLPRVMTALAADSDVFFHGDEVALARLPPSGFPDRWPPRAVAAVERFAMALWLVRIGNCTRDLDATLCMLVSGGLPLGPFLARLDALSDGDLAALLHANWLGDTGGSSIWHTAFWDSSRGGAEWWAWKTGAALLDRMTAAGVAGDERAAAVSDLIWRTAWAG